MRKRRIERRLVSFRVKSVKITRLAQCHVAAVDVALCICLARAFERGVAVGISFGFALLNCAGCRLVMQLRIDCLRRGRPGRRVKRRQMNLRLGLVDLRSAWAGLSGAGEQYEVFRDPQDANRCRISQRYRSPRIAHVGLRAWTQGLKPATGENVRPAKRSWKRGRDGVPLST